jgi:hypothetical protein
MLHNVNGTNIGQDLAAIVLMKNPMVLVTAWERG